MKVDLSTEMSFMKLFTYLRAKTTPVVVIQPSLHTTYDVVWPATLDKLSTLRA